MIERFELIKTIKDQDEEFVDPTLLSAMQQVIINDLQASADAKELAAWIPRIQEATSFTALTEQLQAWGQVEHRAQHDQMKSALQAYHVTPEEPYFHTIDKKH